MAEPALPVAIRVALVHDWLTGMRGGEKCLEVFCEIFPEADIFTLLHVPGQLSRSIEDHRIVTSWIQRLPSAQKVYRWALPLFPAAIEAFDLNGYDLVLTSSHCVAKSARPAKNALSVCYCHTPMRYVWDRFDDYFGDKTACLRWPIALAAGQLRRWDARTARRVRLWLANSTVVRQRILDYYGVDQQDIDIIHPPVDTNSYRSEPALEPPNGLTHRGYDLVVSALVPYKRVDLAVEAARRSGRHLVVVGGGPERERLEILAGGIDGSGRVTFAGAVSSQQLPRYYQNCRSFVFPGVEDFGITPLEATACGRPVVAYRRGGALDTVIEGVNGIFFDEQSVAALQRVLADPRLEREWDAVAMADHARRFSRERFRRQITARLAVAWQRHARGEPHV